ncbi:hypothetical protein [Pediococcus pentosaceus]|uniref:hypothetical protein n=1 Tax=Pediococcus pentosaceus TaxID=1255 RepID=UPI000C0857BB|nr:hypothetical protein [Pediococcus pentosaceus]QYY85489.1 hypothetical protein GRI00_02515 [Pediococcus pentosaceus]
MTEEEKKILLDALLFYRDERNLDGLPMDKNYRYYDTNSNGTINYDSVDAKDANNLSNLIQLFS